MGVTYNYNRHLTVGVDYSLQKWADVNYKGDDVDNDMHETYTYCDRHKISMGAEYIPNLIGRSYQWTVCTCQRVGNEYGERKHLPCEHWIDIQ